MSDESLMQLVNPLMTQSLPDVSGLDFVALEARRRAIIAKGNGNPDSLPDEELHELVAICAALRRRTAGPPRTAKVAKKSGPKSLADL